jgi:hypothetical protein
MDRLVPRIRFSLRTFFLTLLVMSLIGSNLYVSFKWRLANTEVQRLRDELGVLTIDDPTRFYVRYDPLSDDLVWRWRIYVPPGAFSSRLSGGGIPETGTKVTGGGGGTNANPGEYTITARVERGPLGRWRVTLSGPGFGQMVAILPQYSG